MTIGILIAAAGKSQRYQKAGGKTHKLNSALGDHTLFEQTLINAIASGLPIHVVTRPDNVGVVRICLRFDIPCSTLKSEGLGESIAFGVQNTLHWYGWLIHLADMPYINGELFRRVANALQHHSLVRPVYKGQVGHPVAISAKYRNELIHLSGDDGAKSILRDRSIYQIEVNDNHVVTDIDYPL